MSVGTAPPRSQRSPSMLAGPGPNGTVEGSDVQRPTVTPDEAAHRLTELNTASFDRESEPTADLISEILEITQGLTASFGAVYFDHDQQQQLVVHASHVTPPTLCHLRGLLQQALQLANIAVAERTAQAGRVGGEDPMLVVTVPVVAQQGNSAIAVLVRQNDDANTQATTAYLIQLLTWVAAYLSSHLDAHTVETPASSSDGVGEMLPLLQQLSKLSDQQAVAQAIADWVRQYSGAQAVVLGRKASWWDGSLPLVHSGGIQIDQRSQSAVLLREACEETLLATASVGAEAAADQPQTSTIPKLRKTAGLHVAQQWSLRSAQGDPNAAVLLLASPDQPAPERTIPNSTLDWLGHQLDLAGRAQPNLLVRKLGLHRWSKPWYRQPALWSCLGALLLLMLIPLPLTVHCPLVVQPLQRRYMSVPYEGTLQEVLIKPGELVSAGQLVARMDGRDVQWEIADVTAELQAAEKQQDTASAAFDTAAAQLASLEAKRLQLRLDVLNNRLNNLEIRSPVDGWVMGGDPRKLEGARLSMGETLLEIGAVDRLLVELEVPDEDVSHVLSDQQVSCRLDALTWHSLQGNIALIHPRAEIRENENVFVAEFEVDNPDRQLRPGMRGRAKIYTARHPLGWNLFHKAWSWVWSVIAW